MDRSSQFRNEMHDTFYNSDAISCCTTIKRTTMRPNNIAKFHDLTAQAKVCQDINSIKLSLLFILRMHVPMRVVSSYLSPLLIITCILNIDRCTRENYF